MTFVSGTEIVRKRNTQIGSIIETSYLVINQTDELQKQSLFFEKSTYLQKIYNVNF